MRVQEPACRDDNHMPEDVPWMAWEHGMFYTDEGKMIQVGTVKVMTTSLAPPYSLHTAY
jgi:hypothetical protein